MALLLLVMPFLAFAHPGRTDAYGCHTCRTNCPSWGLSYGEYHCHNAKALPQPEEPIKSKYGESGTGYTIPAPEYKQPAIRANPPVKKVEPKLEEQARVATSTIEQPQKQLEVKAYSDTYNINKPAKVSFWKKVFNWFSGR